MSTTPDHGDAAPLRMTCQRRVILEELRQAEHPTAGELFQRVRQRLPRIGLGTVYRNLNLLARRGAVGTLGGSTCQPQRYDARTAPHAHLRCRRCGRVDDADVPCPDGLMTQAARASGYEVRGYRLTFVGLCPACRRDGKRQGG